MVSSFGLGRSDFKKKFNYFLSFTEMNRKLPHRLAACHNDARNAPGTVDSKKWLGIALKKAGVGPVLQRGSDCLKHSFQTFPIAKLASILYTTVSGSSIRKSLIN